MTRETKIGLLVGLAFIIVIGILLSDHLTSSTEPPQAALAGAGSNVRQAVTVPGQPPPQPAQPAPTNNGPAQQVPTRDELTPGPNPVSIVKVGPAAGANAPNAAPDSTVATTPPQPSVNPSEAVARSESGNPADPPTITKAPPTSASGSPIDSLARQHGEELVLLDNNGRAVRGKISPRGPMAEYKAEPGDSLSKMALKLMGANNKANRDAIVAANQSLKSDPNKVIVGRTYLIPTSAESTAAVLNGTPAVTTTPTETAPKAQAPATESPDTGEYWYTVKPGDSLWKIATEQCGKASALAAIKELNKETLTGDSHDQVIAGMKLRLPAKPIARAN